ncbi:hypothetical protein [Pontibacillus marinus]|uniref:Uncharacterized protein n=1 Tax=Pontibacillus marinus BH030004 = DSM 16465 TaxID=1385511 RepID=A0A0A5GF61_9BACI|nr:hypothetical protein [Pontibacillus marinus]KGX91856.1 hypothetical protein N783_00165 [Pontibacillus marinus BH030004 = DSM 16465]
MFETEVVIKGKHANYVDYLRNEKSANLFKRNMDVYLLAPFVGFYYNHKGEEDNSINTNTKIFADTVIREKLKLEFIYQTVMILHHEGSSKEKVKAAFDSSEHQVKENMEVFHSYTLGGIEKLYEKLVEESYDEEDYLNELFSFIQEFNNENTKEEIDILELARQ